MARKKYTTIPRDIAFNYYCTPHELTGKYPSYEMVAEKFKCTERAIEKIGRAENWVFRRAELGKKLAEAFLENREELVKKVNQEGYEIWEKFLKAVTFELNLTIENQKEFAEKRQVEGVDAVIRRRVNKTYSDDFKNFAVALKEGINGQRVILGLPTEVSKGEVTTINKNGVLTNEDLEKIDNRLNKYDIQQQQATVSPTN